MAKQQISLYIDDSSISVMASKGREPQKWATVALDRGLIKEGVVQDQQAVAAKIKDLWRDSHILRRKVTVGISGLNCLYQMLLLPELPENLRSEAIAREAAHSLGIPLEGVYLSWQVLAVEHGQMKVYLCVVPKDKVDSIMGALKTAGLRPVAMDIKPLCLARVSSEPRAIIVDTCQESMDIIVLGEGIPEVVRSLQVAPEMSQGERIAVLRSELERSVSFYNAAHLDKPVDLTVPVLVSGDLVEQDSDKASLAGPRERPVRDMESPLIELEGFNPAKYATCIGLALKDVLVTEPGAVANSVVNFNALPEIYQVRKRPLSEVLWVPTVLVGVVLIGMGTWGIFYLKGENSDLEDRRDNINAAIVDQQLQAQDLKALDARVTAAETPAANLTSLLASLDASRDELKADLDAVYDYALDSGVFLDNVDAETEGIYVGGSAPTENEILRYYGRLLYDSGRFSTVIISNMTVVEDGVSFKMELTG
ncbi:MAG: pilus assembly protein PilM [Dehalococcoidia bacterium]|nr:pilus assembly protein PilM [Dehalococcoidia bacterium]